MTLSPQAIVEVARVDELSTVEVYLNCTFVVAVATLYGVSRRRDSGAEEGTKTWQVVVLCLALLHAVQMVVSYTHATENGSRKWLRFYFLGLDFAIDSTMFSLLFGLRQPAAVSAIALETSALALCLYHDPPPSGAVTPGVIDGILFGIALVACVRSQEKASRAAFARDVRHEFRHSIDLRALQQPFSAGNLSAWLRAFANRTATASSCRIESSGSGSGLDLVANNAMSASSENEDEDDLEAATISSDHGNFVPTPLRTQDTTATSTTSKTPPRQPKQAPFLASAERTVPADDSGTAASSSTAQNATSTLGGGASSSSLAASAARGASSAASLGQQQQLQQKQQQNLLSQNTKRFETLQNWEIDYERLRVVRKIGAGSAGHVYKGEYIGAVVAIKQLYSTFIDPSNLDEFSREVTLLHKLKHPHVLTFYGIARRDVYCYIVTEFCPFALDAILCGASGNDASRPPPRLSVVRRVRIAHEVALALAYLHAERVLHHDLKPGNILLNSDFVARVSDFGLSQLVSRESEVAAPTATYSTLGGTATFSAPEITQGTVRAGFHSLSKLDVFSFGIVIAATFAPNGDPYYFYVGGGGAEGSGPVAKNGAFEMEIMKAVAYAGLRPRVPAALPDEIRPLMERCWAHNPQDRPSFDDIARDLRAFLVDRNELEDSMPSRLPVGPEAIVTTPTNKLPTSSA